MHLHDIVLASPIANSNQRALSPQKIFIHIYHLLVLVTGWESYYDMCFLLYNSKKEKRREAHSPCTQLQSLAEITIILLHA